MGRHCGFSFYRLVDGKLEDAAVVTNPWLEDENKLCNWLQIDGRCDATTIFLDLVINKQIYKNWREERKPEEKYTAYLLLNHPELDGFKKYWKVDELYDKSYEGWFDKYFYFGIDNFKSHFDFEEAQKTHDRWIQNYKDDIQEYKQEIELLRTHQEKVETKAAFDGFEETINKLREDISSAKTSIHDLEEDDYNYSHYMIIKLCIEKVEKVIVEHPDVVAVAWAND